MAIETLQITHVRIASHYEAHRKIHSVGGVIDGVRWELTESEVIRRIESRKWSFFVRIGDLPIGVEIATHNDRQYIRTHMDGYAPSSLIRLAATH
ncbi:DUF3892 domain-containing protein [Asaia krungthepensis]|uniref:DUF3892 domain-containing protein n=1 Tax=Asaia krungthepensis NRIC 0535 TaxID=1307925 RepID=A0ABQ0Q3T0_9PROT|nr:DUF3892 domain-containing protein [Asaia krungthepensis]GBQ89943.1 hypothetical protein AA0535_1923 [Asaia krungthepensis NRIC 0535]